MQELWFMRSACRLIFIDIYMELREDNLSMNSFQIIERTRFGDYKCKSYSSCALHVV